MPIGRNCVADDVCVRGVGHSIVSLENPTLGPNGETFPAREILCSRCGMSIEEIRAYKPVLRRAKRTPKTDQPIPE